MTGPRRAVVVGASLAGVTAVDTLRLRGFDGRITLIGDEPHRAYSRPALSKGILTGAESAASVLLPPVGAGVEVLSGVRATGLDLAARRVRLAGGGLVPYDLLVIATGARARRLTPDRGETDGGEIVLRGLDDALALRDRLAAARSVLVVGGGFLGMEVASAAAERGVAATVVDVRPHLAALGPWLAQRFAAAARARGVRLVVSPAGVRRLDDTTVALGTGATLDSGAALDSGATLGTGATLGFGATLTADLVVTAIGDRPEVDWLTGAGLPLPGATPGARPGAAISRGARGALRGDALAGGLLVDSRCRVTDRVVAAGDVVAFPGADGTPRRLPHWDAALAQARVAAAALLDGDAAAPYTPDPYYWTEAFGLAVKIAGPLPVAGPPATVEGSVAGGSFLARWDGAPRPTVVAVNHRISVGKLRRLARTDLPQPTTR